ncbi:MAG: L,D-transpeptidase family protein [Candidatus Neomarinimicrobiota bacterium]
MTDSKTIATKKPAEIVLKITLIFLTGLFILNTMPNCASRSPLNNCRQLVVVVTPHWEASQGILYRFTRNEVYDDWQPVTNPVPVILGRSGMGWGRGFRSCLPPNNPRKTEGDGRSPAGIFKLGDAFGFPPAGELPGLKILYRPVNEFLECIDDVNSRYYTQLIERKIVNNVDWVTSEVISQSPNAYYLGVVVEYNTVKPVKGAGSCIFLHCWTAPDDSTAGCTTLDRPEMEKLVRWLDAAAQPKLVQLPLLVYRRLRDKWQLPPIK